MCDQSWCSYNDFEEDEDEFDEEVEVILEKDDLCIVITLDGDFYAICYKEVEDILKEADFIHEKMIDLMSFDDLRGGLREWRIKEDKKTVLMETLEFYD